MSNEYTVELRNQPREKAWTFEPLRLPGLKAQSLLDADGLEQRAAAWQQDGAQISWVASEEPPAGLKVVLTFAPPSTTEPSKKKAGFLAKAGLPVLLAVIAAVPTTWGVISSSKSSALEESLKTAELATNAEKDKLATCNSNLDAKKFREITDGLLDTLAGGGTP